jgi:pectinesterase
LTDTIAPCFTAKRYLGDWDPLPSLPEASTLTPTLTVAADGSGSHKTVQEAIKAATGTARVYILVKPGKYRETVCVQGTTPITLYGAEADATKVTIAYDNVNGKSVGSGLVNECQPATGTFGTTTSSAFFVKANDFQAMNMTIANDHSESGGETAQAVAMTTHGDRLQFQNIRFLGNQDTLQPGAPSATTKARSYYKSCFVEGDTDFIFGSGTAVFDKCDISYVGTRKTGGSHMAPSTDKSNTYGFLFTNSHFIAGSGAKAGAARLGRAWDVSNKPNSNGAAIIRESEIDNHINTSTPWGESTESRAFSADGNRMYEYKNTGTGAAK